MDWRQTKKLIIAAVLTEAGSTTCGHTRRAKDLITARAAVRAVLDPIAVEVAPTKPTLSRIDADTVCGPVSIILAAKGIIRVVALEFADFVTVVMTVQAITTRPIPLRVPFTIRVVQSQLDSASVLAIHVEISYVSA